MNASKTLIAVIIALSAVILGSHAALAQQGDTYTPLVGDLIIEGGTMPGSTVVLSGDGFAPDAPVAVLVVANATAEVAHEEQTTAGPDGSVRFELVIDTDRAPGQYTASLRGPVTDGATLELAGALVVEPTPTTTVTPTTSTVAQPEVAGTVVTTEPDIDESAADEPAISIEADEIAAGPLPDDDGSSSGGGALTWIVILVVVLGGFGLLWHYSKRLGVS